MAIGRTNAGGGSTNKSTIIAIAPAGSMATLTSDIGYNRTKTIVAKNLLDIDLYKSMVTTAWNGYMGWVDDGFYIVATANDCYTTYGPSISVPVLPNTTYTLSWKSYDVAGTVVVFTYDTNNSQLQMFYTNSADKSLTFTTHPNTAKVSFRFGVAASGTSNFYTDLQLELGATKTQYSRYNSVKFDNLPPSGYHLAVTKDGQTARTDQYIARTGVYYWRLTYFSATIAVTYPAGSTCTCSKDGKTFTAPNTSGLHTFTVDSAGTWTVTATDGSRSKSVSVVISASGESKSAVLNYALVLYDHGVIEMAVSGGLVANQGGGLIRFDSDNIYFANRTDSNNNESLRSQNLMDLSEYTRLCAEVTYIYGSSLTMSVLNEANSAVCKISIPSNNDNTVRVLDISAVSVPCRFAFSSSLSSCRIYKIWFE